MKLRSRKSRNPMPFFHIYLLKSRKYNPAKQPRPQEAKSQGKAPWGRGCPRNTLSLNSRIYN